MIKSSTITIKTDPETKKTVKNLFSSMGMSVSEAVNLFFSKSISENKIPFKTPKPRYNKLTMDAIKEVREMKKHPELFKTFTSMEELIKDLESDDDV